MAATVRARKPRRPSGRRGFRARTVTPRAKRDVYGKMPAVTTNMNIDPRGKIKRAF